MHATRTRFCHTALWLSMLLLAATQSGCGNLGERGEAAISVQGQALSSADVARVEVTVSGVHVSPVMTSELVARADDWYGVIGAIPIGANRTFTARAYDAAGTLLYQGEATGVTIAAGTRAQVLIVLQQVTPPDPFVNQAPRIDSLVASAQQVAPGATVSLALVAHDADPGDTLTYSWTAAGGSFTDAGQPTTSWTAPGTEGAVTLTCTVTDNHGASVSISLAIDVRAHHGTGEAEVIATLNTWPVASGVTAAPAQIAPGETVALDLSAADADGDSLSYSWTDGGGDCAGSFSASDAEDPSWTAPAGAPAAGTCTLAVTISDGRGGETTASVLVHVGDLPSSNIAPRITATFQSALTVSAGDGVTFRISAEDPEGAPLSFAWTTTSGTLGTPTTSGGDSEVSWTAPNAGTSSEIRVSITDGAGGETTHVFTVSGPTVARTFTPGSPIVVPNTNTYVEDVFRSAAGTLFVVSYGPSYVGGITVNRSSDGGATWNRTDLGSAGSNHTYNGRIFAIDAQTIGVAGTQGTTSPYDGFIRTTTDDGLTFSSSWTNMSLSGDLYGNKNHPTVIETASGSYLGIIPHSELYTRTSSTLSSWSATTRSLLPNMAGRTLPYLSHDGSGGLLMLVTNHSAGVFELYRTVDEGATFSLVGSLAVPDLNRAESLYVDTQSGLTYACITTKTGAGWSVATTTSADGGATWTAPETFLSAIPNASNYRLGCHIDTTGMTIVYRDSGDNQVKLIRSITAPSWAVKSDLSAARLRHTLTTLASGKVLMAGGDNHSSLFAAVMLYDPATDSWSAKQSLPAAKTNHAAVLLDDSKVLVFAGADGGCTYSKTAYLYDPAADSWAPTGSLQGERSGFGYARLQDGRVLVAGGMDRGCLPLNSLSSAEIYDPTTEIWTATPAMTQKRIWLALALLSDGRAIAAGGQTAHGQGGTATSEIYDPATNTWTTGPALNYSRLAAKATALADGRVLLSGGHDSGNWDSAAIAAAEVYDPQSNTWSATAPMNHPRYWHDAVLLGNGRVLVVGGNNDTKLYLPPEIYDPATNSWLLATPNNDIGEFPATAKLANGSVLVVGGRNPARTTPQKTVLVYRP
jgi:N-acetylneuraminic acid mutarotase